MVVMPRVIVHFLFVRKKISLNKFLSFFFFSQSSNHKKETKTNKQTNKQTANKNRSILSATSLREINDIKMNTNFAIIPIQPNTSTLIDIWPCQAIGRKRMKREMIGGFNSFLTILSLFVFPANT